MRSDDLEALLLAVLRDPERDDIRLIYADMLEEAGQAERAEFIRAQVRLAKLPPPRPVLRVRNLRPSPAADDGWPLWYVREREYTAVIGGPFPAGVKVGSVVDAEETHEGSSVLVPNVRIAHAKYVVKKGWVSLTLTQGVDDSPRELRESLLARERKLLGADLVCSRCDWHAPLPHGGWQWEWRRGFIDSVTCKFADWQAHGPALVRRHPVREVRLAGTHPDVREYGGGDDRWCWHRASLPFPVFNALCNGRGREFHFTEHSTSERALAALSAACLSWARSVPDGAPPCQPAG